MDDLKVRVEKVVEKIDVEGKKYRLKEIEAETLDPTFWKDQQKATNVMKEMASLQKEIDSVQELQRLVEAKNEKEAEKLLEELETLLYFSGKYDKSAAIISIHSGQGGVEAMDWAQMLFQDVFQIC